MTRADQLLIVVGMLALVAASLRYARFRVDALNARISDECEARENARQHFGDRDCFTIHGDSF
jgi:hypothetical protein